MAKTIEKNPVVFISYSWDNEDHKEWVLNLANKLCSDGIDVVLDRYILNAGKPLQHFIETSLSSANKIVIVLTPNYKAKAENRAGGVGHEYSIINSELYANQNSNKVIPVLRNGTKESSIPMFIRQVIHVDFTQNKFSEQSYSELLDGIFDTPPVVKPPIGTMPDAQRRKRQSSNPTVNYENKTQPFVKSIENTQRHIRTNSFFIIGSIIIITGLALTVYIKGRIIPEVYLFLSMIGLPVFTIFKKYKFLLVLNLLWGLFFVVLGLCAWVASIMENNLHDKVLSTCLFLAGFYVTFGALDFLFVTNTASWKFIYSFFVPIVTIIAIMFTFVLMWTVLF